MDFRLPDLGEGIDGATVTAVLVKPGDTVAAGQNVLSVETDKAAMEVEAAAAGTVEAVLVKPGDKVRVGGPVLRLKAGTAQASGGREPAVPEPSKNEPKTQAAAAPRSAEPKKEQPADPGRSPEAAPATGPSQFKLPSLGEGIDAATVTAVLVKVGEAVKAGQNVLSVETDKAAMEIEADAAGTVEQVHVKPGDKIGVGTVILTLTGASGRPPPPPRRARPRGRPPRPPRTGRPTAPPRRTPRSSRPARPPAGWPANSGSASARSRAPAGPAGSRSTTSRRSSRTSGRR